MRNFRNRLGVAIAIACAPVASTLAGPADFYRGKTVEILVGFSTGGGYDAYARALSTVIGKYIPGNPSVVVRNMTGAGSLRLAMYLHDAAPKDGLTFGIFDNGLMIAPMLKPATVKFDASKLSWIGSVSKDTQVCSVWHKPEIGSLTDLRATPATFGVTGLDDIRYMSTAMLKHVAGANIKIVSGYPGSSDIRLAMENGEVNGVCDSWQSLKATKPDWLEQKKIKILVQMAIAPIKDLPDTPVIASFGDAASLAGAFRILLSPSEAGRSFAAPPGTPDDRLEALRRAFDAAVKDEGFLSLAERSKLDVDPIAGEAVERFLKRIYSSSNADIEIARKLIE